MRRMVARATVVGREAVAAAWVGFFQLPLRQPVEAEQQVIVSPVKRLAGARHQGLNKVRLIEERRLNDQFHAGRPAVQDGSGFFHRGLVAGHRVVRKERDQEDLVDAVFQQIVDGLLDPRVLVAHSQFNRGADSGLKFLADILAGDDKWAALGQPNFPVGLGGFFWAGGKDQEFNQKEPDDPGDVHHSPIHQEFAQESAHIAHGR